MNISPRMVILAGAVVLMWIGVVFVKRSLLKRAVFHTW